MSLAFSLHFATTLLLVAGLATFTLTTGRKPAESVPRAAQAVAGPN